MTTPVPAVSIIIPLAAEETEWRTLLPRLPVGGDDEIILAANTTAPADFTAAPAVRWLHCERSGRAAQMNTAAAAAGNNFLWFVHADSRPAAAALPRLRQALHTDATALYYFPLRFYDGGHKMRINELGVFLRCALFHNPFGDQAFCLSHTVFWQLGGYAEDAPYGEDHLLALAARRAGIRLRRVKSCMATGARRYVNEGWWKTVIRFQRLWLRQWRQY